MMIIQIVLILFFIFALFKVWGRFKAGELALLNASWWSVLWVVAAVFVWQPSLAAQLAKFLGVGRGVDAVLYLAVVGLFFIMFRILVRVEKMEKNITNLVRSNALNKNINDKK